MNGKAFLALLARDAACRPPQPDSTVAPDVLAAAVVRLHFRTRDGGQRLSSACLQEPAAARHYGDQHGVYGIWAVAMPLIAEFQFTREIEDRLLAPINISWVAIEKSSRA